MIFLPLLAILGYVAAVSRSARWPAEVALFSVVAGVMVVLFWAAFFGILQGAAWLLLCVGVTLALSEAWRRPWLKWLTPGLVAVLGITILHWLRLRGAYVWSWDDFSHWSLQGKVIALTHALPTRDDPVVFKDYPAGAALFRYFMNLGKGFDEGTAMTAQGFLAFAAVGTALQSLSWRQWPAVLAFSITGYGLVYFLGEGFNTTLIDQALGVVFGATLVVYFLASNQGGRGAARAAAGIAALPLLKPIGFHLALLAVGIIALDMFIRWIRFRMPTAGHQSALAQFPMQHIVAIAALVGLAFVSTIGWRAYASSVQDRASFSTRPSADQVLNSFSPTRASDRDRATINAFSKAFSGQSITIVDELPNVQSLLQTFPALQRLELSRTNPPQLAAIPTSHWLILFLSVAIPVCVLQPAGMRTRSFSIQALLALGFCAYALAHLLAYLFAFSEHEGRNVASFDRYMRTYFLGWAVVVLGLLAFAYREGRYPRFVHVTIVSVALLMVLLMPARAVRFLNGPTPAMIAQRAALKPQVDEIRTRVAPDARVYVVFQNSNGFELWITKYELAPMRSNVDCWSVGGRYGVGDVWTCDLTAAQLRERLLRFDYLYIGRADEQFWQLLSEAFPDAVLSRDAVLLELTRDPSGAQRPVAVDVRHRG